MAKTQADDVHEEELLLAKTFGVDDGEESDEIYSVVVDKVVTTTEEGEPATVADAAAAAALATPLPTSSDSGAPAEIEEEEEDEEDEEEYNEGDVSVSVEVVEVDEEDDDEEEDEQEEEDQEANNTLNEADARELVEEVMDIVADAGKTSLRNDVLKIYNKIVENQEELAEAEAEAEADADAEEDISEHASDEDVDANDALEADEVLSLVSKIDEDKAGKFSFGSIFNRKRKRSRDDDDDDDEEDEQTEEQAEESTREVVKARPKKRVRQAIATLSTLAVGAAAGSVMTIAALIAAAPQQ